MSTIPVPTALKLAMAQANPTMGDVAGNLELARKARAEAALAGADLVVFSELFLSGYPPEDLVYRGGFLDQIDQALAALALDTLDGGPGLLIGAPVRQGEKRYNAAVLIDGGAITGHAFKHHLPNYDVFDELRTFDRGPLPEPLPFRGVRLGVPVCEDMWHQDVCRHLKALGADLLIVPNGSPFDVNKQDARLEHVRARTAETGLSLVYVNQLGGQDELVFDGGGFVCDPAGEILLSQPHWQDALTLTSWTRVDDALICAPGDRHDRPETDKAIYQAMMLGLRDYVNKTGFPGVILGLSGGIDSALSAAVAVDALGPDRVWCVMMPSPYTSQESLEDAEAVAKALGTRLDSINIGPAMAAFDEMLGPYFAERTPDLTEENIQSRTRGLTLMGLSNKFGPMLLTTGNKSEMSVGYATLYGDMCGGYSVLKDVYKLTVFEQCRLRNGWKPEGALGPEGAVMPERVITKPPSAELRPDQKDEDSLPPYERLDRILHGLVEERLSIDETAQAKDCDRDEVAKVFKLLMRAEYKRRQAPPGVKITSLSFGRDRRYPIVNGYGG
ncbi:MAG: NAD+ synthase [Rhodospirillaceae bacterium]